MATPESVPLTAAAPPLGSVAASGLPRRTLIAYSLPLLGIGSLDFLFHTYLLKFATDVLLVAPAALGTVFLIVRLWDAVSDPLAGYLSDRTRSRLGRRRPWMLASALPVALLSIMAWSPPAALEGWALLLWLTLGVLGFETATTAFFVPHTALGAELSSAHHERTRVFGYRHVAFTLGTVIGGAAVYAIIEASDKRAVAAAVVGIGAVASALLILQAGWRLREPVAHLGRGGAHPFPAFVDVWRNPHARLLLLIYFIEFGSMATLGVLGPFFVQYIVGDESLFPLLILAYIVPAILFVPVALRLSRRFGKKRTWMASMSLTGLAFGGLAFVPPDGIFWLAACGVVIGVGMTCGSAVGPSVQADVIDWDEHATGERKEGAYFATWNFVRKCASGVVVWLVGMALQYAGFEPNAEQGEATQLVIRVLFCAFPFAGALIGVALFSRFRLTQEAHARIRAELDARAAR